MTAGPRLLGPRLLKTGPRLLDTAAGPRLLGPRLLKTGPRLLKTQSRQLHMTGSATYPSHLLNMDKSVANEDKPVKSERPIISSYSSEPKTKQTRHFNTSRELKAVNDNSTIDFAYLPDATVLAYGNSIPELRVPILPLTLNANSIDYDNNAGELQIPVHRPIISTATADSSHISSPSAVSDLSQVTEHLDFHAIEDKVTEIVQNVAEKVASQGQEKGAAEEKAQGLVKQVWKGLMEDVWGNKATKA